jgi:hypothetical protein
VQELGRAPNSIEEVKMEYNKKYSEFEHFYKLMLFDESENEVQSIGSGIYRYKSYRSAAREAEAILRRASDLVSHVEGYLYENESDEGVGGKFVFKADLLRNEVCVISSGVESHMDTQDADDSESSNGATAQASKQPFREYN